MEELDTELNTDFLRGFTMAFHSMSPISSWIGVAGVRLFRWFMKRESKTSLRANRPKRVASI
jgi:hypothetical protein